VEVEVALGARASCKPRSERESRSVCQTISWRAFVYASLLILPPL